MDVFHITELPEDLKNETISKLTLKDLIKYCNISHGTKEYCLNNARHLLRNYRRFLNMYEDVNDQYDDIDYSIALNGLFFLYNNFMNKMYDIFKNGNIQYVKIKYGQQHENYIVLEIPFQQQPILVTTNDKYFFEFVRKLDRYMRLRNVQNITLVLDYIFNILIETNHSIKIDIEGEKYSDSKTIYSL